MAKLDPNMRARKILNLLWTNKVRIFSELIHSIPLLRNAILNPSLSLILAPTDDAIKRLEMRTRKTAESFKNNLGILDILANHISIKPYQRKPPLIESINGKIYGTNRQEVENLQIVSIRKIDGVTIIIISVVVIHEPQLDNVLTDSGVFESLDYQNFLNIVEHGKLKGKDLVSFCLSNDKIGYMCDRTYTNGKTLFDKLLLIEFGLTEPLDDDKNARETYIRLHQSYRLYASTAIATGQNSWAIEFEPVLDSRSEEAIMDVKSIRASGQEFYLILNSYGEVLLSSEIETREEDDAGNLIGTTYSMSDAKPISFDLPNIKKMTTITYLKQMTYGNLVTHRPMRDASTNIIFLDEDGAVYEAVYNNKTIEPDWINYGSVKSDWSFFIDNIVDIESEGLRLYMLNSRGEILIAQDDLKITDKEYEAIGYEMTPAGDKFLKISNPVGFSKLFRRGAIDNNGSVHRDIYVGNKLPNFVKIEGMSNIVEADALSATSTHVDNTAAISSDGILYIFNDDKLTVHDTAPNGRKWKHVFVNKAYTDDFTAYVIDGDKIVPFTNVPMTDGELVQLPEKFLYYQSLWRGMMYLTP